MAAAGGLGIAAVAGVWLARVPIASGFIDRELGRRGVTARYTVTDLGFGRQRLTNVVIGDPARPDLVADWIETATDIGPSGATLTGVRAGQVRIRARLADGRVSLGAIDRLLPAPSGGPFTLPALAVSVDDARIRLETPAGPVGVRLAGSGRLSDGFRGRIAAVAPALATGGCTLAGVTAALRIAIDARRPTLTGPVAADRAACGTTRIIGAQLALATTLGEALDRWRGTADIAAARLATPQATTGAITGEIAFDGTAGDTRGTLDLTTAQVAAAQGRAAQVAITGTYRTGQAPGFDGRIKTKDTVNPALVAYATRAADGAAGTPIAPIAARIARGLAAAARGFDADATLAWQDGALTVSRIALASASGARAMVSGGRGVAITDAGVRLDGALALRGGGLPDATITLTQRRPGAPVTGVATIARYAAGDTRLALTPIRFTTAGNAPTRIETVATLSGPLGDGRVDALTLPVAALWNRAGSLTINPGCTPLSFDRLAVSSLTLRPSRLSLCARGPALVTLADGRVGGGALIAAPRLAGTLGGSPVTLAANAATLDLASRGFAIDALAARLGARDRQTRLDIAALDGRLANGRIAGRFTGGAGRIGNVPLLLADAAGDWTLANGRLALDGALGVSDAQAASPRFRPLVARAVTLSLAGGTIAATGTLVEPVSQRKVADVSIDHRLSGGTGHATLAVRGIVFDDTLQPDALTPITFGVIANVKGTVTGDGRIDWTPAGVTSTGRFATAGIDLAAAFGPVTGIAGTIAFTDLLALESAPGQVARIASLNPGIPVTDGRIVYQTYAGARVLVGSGTWPFAGGTLTLDPTLLDFSSTAARRLTFRVAGTDAGKFLQQFDFRNLAATGVFDGTLPMLFDAGGGRIEGGTLVVRRGGGTLAYVGDLSRKDLGFWSNLAFRALKSLRYRDLSIEMNGPLAGEMVTGVRFAGISQGAGAKSNFLIRRLQELPFVFNIQIKAPFRGLLDSAQSFYDPSRLIQRNLQPLLEQQRRARQPVQPPASETVP